MAIGGVAREVSVASLMAFLLSLPIAFVALVPGDAVSGTLQSILDAIAFVFPFKAALAGGRQRVQRAPRRASAGRSCTWPCSRSCSARWRGWRCERFA